MLDRAKLLLAATAIGAALVGLIFLIEKVLPDALGMAALILLGVVEVIWWLRLCRKRGLSPWTGKPFPSNDQKVDYELESLSWAELEGIAATKHNDTA